MKITTHQIVAAGLLTALTVLLGSTPLGFIPLPNVSGAATIVHVPVIIAGILEGPLVGSFVGLLFGIFTYRFLPDFRVIIPARLFIGVVSFYVYHAVNWYLTKRNANLRWGHSAVAAAIAGFLGSMTNTVGTLLLAVKFVADITGPVAWGIALTNGLPESLIAAALVGAIIPPVTVVVKRYRKRATLTTKR